MAWPINVRCHRPHATSMSLRPNLIHWIGNSNKITPHIKWAWKIGRGIKCDHWYGVITWSRVSVCLLTILWSNTPSWVITALQSPQNWSKIYSLLAIINTCHCLSLEKSWTKCFFLTNLQSQRLLEPFQESYFAALHWNFLSFDTTLLRAYMSTIKYVVADLKLHQK